MTLIMASFLVWNEHPNFDGLKCTAVAREVGQGGRVGGILLPCCIPCLVKAKGEHDGTQ